MRAARSYVKTALSCHDLSDRSGDVEAVTSELVSNAVTHTRAEAVDMLLLKDDSGVVAVVVFDSCPRPPVRRDPAADAEKGRGLNPALKGTATHCPQPTWRGVSSIIRAVAENRACRRNAATSWRRPRSPCPWRCRYAPAALTSRTPRP